MKDGAVLANAGHFDVEIDLAALRDAATGRRRQVLPLVEQYDLGDRRLNLLAYGRVVNLAAGEGHPASVMDMSFALPGAGRRAPRPRRRRPGAGRPPGARAASTARSRASSSHRSACGSTSTTPEQERYVHHWT